MAEPAQFNGRKCKPNLASWVMFQGDTAEIWRYLTAGNLIPSAIFQVERGREAAWVGGALNFFTSQVISASLLLGKERALLLQIRCSSSLQTQSPNYR
jgi:hypothetical protein